MKQRYLRNRNDGFIYDWHPILAANPLCEEVTEEQAYPERFVKAEAVEQVTRGRRKKGALDLSTGDIPEPPSYTPPELAADASRRLP
jgi:hypothetical protein